jgi:ribA/ribD-fused uncharacterized protein
MNEKFTFFWHGPFSQWYMSDFVVNGIKYNCAEQYMMCGKARLFEDWNSFGQILQLTSPKQMKILGRGIRGFDKSHWEIYAKEIVYDGNKAKFEQNRSLHDQLMATEGSTLVEASPYDSIWGIGLSEKDPRALNRAEWLGTNWLGEILTKLREDLINWWDKIEGGP